MSWPPVRIAAGAGGSAEVLPLFSVAAWSSACSKSAGAALTAEPRVKCPEAVSVSSGGRLAEGGGSLTPSRRDSAEGPVQKHSGQHFSQTKGAARAFLPEPLPEK